ncbi:hypothetical protein [Kutzneria buriramensis]|uniref:DUF4034 domain-containing protein n=1 Tax=Kutzneria buriramensis TaxID=1045776 RepID=A0A3E0HB13_9PSEU|nr:hypothetical protein [Kutzneria buriramensis]REH41234.1 hypothetical protein BCF44_112318 [Kutzneria buriramensis]
MTTPSVRRFDQAAAFPELVGLRDAVRAADWTAIELFFAGLSDVDMTAFAVKVVADVTGAEEFLEQLPPSPLARLLLGARLISKAWEIRTGYRAKHVSQEQFAGMRAELVKAEPILMELTARDPGDVVAWSFRLRSGRGLEVGQGEVRRRYDRLARFAPHSYSAQSQMVQQLCPKWSGSWDALHTFARECMDAAAPGSLNPVVVGEAHFEHYVGLDGAEAGTYLRHVTVQREIRAAAEKSVLHPDFAGGYHWPQAYGVFAVLFGKMGDHERAVACFRALGDTVASEYPWQNLHGDPAVGFASVRDQVLGGAK